MKIVPGCDFEKKNKEHVLSYFLSKKHQKEQKKNIKIWPPKIKSSKILKATPPAAPGAYC